MIGFIEKPTGRMGNVMIQYAFLRQVAKRIGVDYFHTKLPYAEHFSGWNAHNLSWKILFAKKWEVEQKYINKIGIEKFILEAKEKNKSGYYILLKPPMLGHLFDFKDENPGVLFEINSKYKKAIDNPLGKKIIGLHFRGGDFKAWNEKASLKFEYYHAAIKCLSQMYDREQIKFVLFTDDTNFETYLETVQYIKKEKFDYVAEKNPMMVDFYQMTQCDVIVSSPSTYAIMATIMGKQDKLLFHNKAWVDYCVEKKEPFWMDVAEGNVPYYTVYKFL